MAQLRNPVLWALGLILLIGSFYITPVVEGFSDIIVFTCSDGSDTEICVMYADGSNYRQLTDNYTDDDKPSINSRGDIVYECERDQVIGVSRQEICFIRFDGTGAKQLTDSNFAKYNPSINDQGWIAYKCMEPGESICRAHINGEVEGPFEDQDVFGRFPKINNANQIVFACREKMSDWHYEICVINTDGSGYKTLSDLAIPILSLDVNDLGQIVYECSPDGSFDLALRELCALSTSGGAVRQLTNNEIFDSIPSINNNGVIVFECDLERTSMQEICTINFDGSGLARVTRDQFDGGYPSVNSSGRVIHVCRERDSELCIVNLDGTDFHMLTSNSTDENRPAIN